MKIYGGEKALHLSGHLHALAALTPKDRQSPMHAMTGVWVDSKANSYSMGERKFSDTTKKQTVAIHYFDKVIPTILEFE